MCVQRKYARDIVTQNTLSLNFARPSITSINWVFNVHIYIKFRSNRYSISPIMTWKFVFFTLTLRTRLQKRYQKEVG